MPKVNNLFYVTRTDPQTGEMVSAQDKRKVFVSYKKDDNRLSGVRDITVRKILSTVDCAVWFDDALTPGVDYKEEIIDAISQCDAVVLVLSRNILKSDFVWDIEVAAAQEQKKGIIPVAFDIGPEDYSVIEEKLGRRQILRWPTGDDEEAAAEEQMKFDEAFERSLDQFVINADLALRVEQFFASGKHNTPACYLNADEHYLMGFGCMRGLGTARDTEKGVALLDSVVHTYGDDEETNRLKGEAARGLSRYNYDKEDYGKSFEYARLGAEIGNPGSMNDIGLMYVKGEGTAHDKAKAAEWFTKAAELGLAGAMYNLGLMYSKGQGVVQDRAKAEEWFTRAAEQGYEAAMFRLGLMCSKTEHDKAKAEEWFTRAAMLGNDAAMEALGRLYRFGDGVSQNVDKAIEWCLQAAERGNVGAMYSLGIMYEHKEDAEQALKWHTKAAESGNANAMSRLGSIYYTGKLVKQNIAESTAWHIKSAETGGAEWMYRLGKSYLCGKGIETNKNEAVKWLAGAAKLGHPNAMMELGSIYYSGDGVDKDVKKAEECYNKAAELGGKLYMFRLGGMYLRGRNADKDVEKAKIWYARAAEKGYSAAQEKLDQLNAESPDSSEVLTRTVSPVNGLSGRQRKAARKAARAAIKAEKQRLRAEKKAARRSGK